MSEVIVLRYVLTKAMGEKDGLHERTLCLQQILRALP